MTAGEFERAYAERSGVSVAQLRAFGRVVRRCGCGARACEGWQSVSLDAALEAEYARAAAWWINIVNAEERMPFSREQLAEIFTYHAPDDQAQLAYTRIREKAYELAGVIVDHTPVSADQTAAIRKLRECVMTANAAIALKGKA